MAILQTPDGTRLQVPDNATPVQIKAIFDAYTAQKHDASAQAGRELAWADTPWYEKAAIGFAKPFVETGLGIKDLFTDLSQDDKALLEAGKGVKGAAGVTGEVLGNVATFAVPGGAASQAGRAAVRFLPRALAGTAKVAPEAAALAGMEALKAPTEERSRGEAALQGLAGAGLGAGAGKVLSKAVSGVAKSPLAQRLMNEADLPRVDLTPGMAAKRPYVRGVERLMASLPFVGGKVANLQGKALGQWNHRTLQSAAPEGVQISAPGTKGFQELDDAFADAYDKIWGQRITLKDDPSKLWLELVQAVQGRVGRGNLTEMELKESTRLVNDFLKFAETLNVARNRYEFFGELNGPALRELDGMLKQAVRQAEKKGDHYSARIYDVAWDALRMVLPENFGNRLHRLDDQFAKFEVLEQAGKKALDNASIFTPSQLLSAVGEKAGKATVREEGLLQKEATEAAELFRGLTPKTNGGLTRADVFGAGAFVVEPVGTTTALGISATLPNNVMRKLLTGQYKGRPLALAALLRQYGVTPATIAAATGTATNDSGR